MTARTRENARRAVRRRWVLAALAGAGAFAAQAQQVQAQRVVNDEAIAPEAVGAVAVCAVCHGEEGQGNAALDAPRIGGLEAWYVERQLEHFRQGIRGGSDEDPYGTQMRAIALTLEGADAIQGLAEYFTDLSPPAPESTVNGDVDRGRELYMVCAACHGENGEGGRQLNTPSLVDMPDWYVLRQLEYFREGIRGSHPEDMFGMQMVPIMQTLSGEQDLVDLTAFIDTLGGGTGAGGAEAGGAEAGEAQPSGD